MEQCYLAARGNYWLARLLLAETQVLLLDEATSALDLQTEAAITQTLLEMCSMKNRLFVAHRLATVQRADHIIVIKDGQIVEEGSPKTLCQQNGLYKILYDTQKLGARTEHDRRTISHKLGNEAIVEDKKAQKYTCSCLRATRSSRSHMETKLCCGPNSLT